MVASDPQFPDGESAADYLGAVGELPDEEIDLARAALALAALDRPMVGLERYLHHIDRLVEEVRAMADPTGHVELDARVGALNHVLFDRFEYEGDSLTYDDLQNANLMRVIDRRKGLPIALSILYIATARALGWEAEGVNFPGHFLVRLTDGRQAVLVDPFRQGKLVSTAELRELLKQFKGEDAELSPEDYARAGNRDILLRLLNNLKLRLLQASDFQQALPVAERAALIAPEEPTVWHDAGVINAQAGNLGRALECLDKVTKLDADSLLQAQVAQLIQDLRGKLN